MNRTVFAITALIAFTTLGETQELTPRAIAELNRDLMRTFSSSVVTVRYYFQKTSEGEEPRLKVPYLCPNCNTTHYNDGNVKVEKNIPMEIAGFVVGPDRVIIQDLFLPTNIIGRIAVVTPSGEVAATEFERAIKNDGLALKTEKPLDGLKPLVFTGVEPLEPKYFFLAREAGFTVGGIKACEMANLTHFVELNRDFYKGNPNTIVIDEGNKAVTLTFLERQVLGEECFKSPTDWEWEDASAFHARRDALKARLGKGVFPVYIQLEAKPKDERGGRYEWRMDESENKNDIDTMGIALEGGKVLVLASLTQDTTARLQRMEATLSDGSKAELSFVGSAKEFGALFASFITPVSIEPLKLAQRSAIEYLGARTVMCVLKNRGGKVDFGDSMVYCKELKRVENNEPVPDFDLYAGIRIDYNDRDAGRELIVDDAANIVALTLVNRRERVYSPPELIAGSKLVALASKPEFDLENVPRKEGDRRRIAWFGAEVQAAGADIIRAKKAASYLDGWTERAPLVTSIAPSSPAALAGIKEGDILISVRAVGSEREERLSVDNDYSNRIVWDELFEAAQFVDASMLRGMTPWSSIEGGINESFAKLGIGTEVEVAWVRDGVRMTGKCTLTLAPVHFENAPKKRNKELGITVCDMTDEVRKYFKLEADAPGVVVVKLKSGGPAAVAGLKPLELITEIDGVGVKDAKAFAEKTKDTKKLTFSVRRLTATRVVPINL